MKRVPPPFFTRMTSHILISRYQPLVDESRAAISDHLQYLLEPGTYRSGNDEDLADLITLWRASERAMQAALMTTAYTDAPPIAMPPDTPEYRVCRRMAAVILTRAVYDERAASLYLLPTIHDIMESPQCTLHPPSCACQQVDGWPSNLETIQDLKDHYKAEQEGAKFKWTLDDETYRIAVKTADGFLQVKSVTDGRGQVHAADCHCNPCANYNMVPRPPWQQSRPLLKTNFENYRAWLDSLPVGGTLAITLADKRTALQRRAQLPSGLTDVEKLEELERRFKLRSTVYVAPSLQQTKDTLSAGIQRLVNEYMDGEGYEAICARLANLREVYNKNNALMNVRTHEECNQNRYIYLQRGTGKLMAYCGDKMYRIASCHGQICRDDGRLFSSFAAMGAKTVIVKYYGKLIAVT